MTSKGSRLVLAVTLAVAIPYLVLLLNTPEERHNGSLAMSPFAKPRLLVAQLVLAVPMSSLIARRLPPRGTTAQRLVIAAMSAVFLGWLASAIGDQLDSADAGPTIRILTRALLAVAWTAPWMIALLGFDQVTLPQWIGASALLILPPALLANRLEALHVEQFQNAAAAGRLSKAQESLEVLADLGSQQRFGKKTVQELRPLLKRDVQRLTDSLAKPLSPTAPLEEKYQRVSLYLRLSRTREAESLLDSLPADNPTTMLLRAATLKEAERWSELLPLSEQLAEILPTDAVVYDTWGEALQKLNRLGEAITVYQRAEVAIATRAGHYQLMQGLVAADRGQSEQALAHFRQAVELDPKLESAVSGPRRRLQADSFSCLSR